MSSTGTGKGSRMHTLESAIRSFIVDNFLFGEGENGLKNEDSLLENGLIDSTGILELVAFIQQSFKLIVEDEEIVPDNLDSIDKIAKFVKRKDEARVRNNGGKP
jgi:acyl carrier protein